MTGGMRLEGSCHCGLVRFSVESAEPLPYQRCYCSICVKTSGGGGYCINLGGDADSLRVQGREHLKQYRALLERDGQAQRSHHRRYFCGECGSHLWAHNDRWPELVHPVAGAIDTPLPEPPEHVHMMVGSKRSWVAIEGKPSDARFDAYPSQSLRAWHEACGHRSDGSPSGGVG